MHSPQRLRIAVASVVALLALAALATLGWFLPRLNAQAGLDQAALAQERVSLGLLMRTVGAIRGLDRYRGALGRPSAATAASAAAAAMRSLHTTAEQHRPRFPKFAGKVAKSEALWTAASRARTAAAATKVIRSLESAIDHLEDESGLTYDPNHNAQRLSDSLFVAAPRSLDYLGRALELAAQASAKPLTLHERLRLAGLIEAIKGSFDLSIDDIDAVLATMRSEIPSRAAELAQILRDGHAYTAAGTRFAHQLQRHVLYETHPTISYAALHATAVLARRKTILEASALQTALTLNLAHREALLRLRARLTFVAILLGILLAGSLLVLLAALFSARARRMLAESQRESERLVAELARRRAEEALRLSEAQFRAVFDRAALGIAILDRRGAVLDANGVFRELFPRNNALLEGRGEQFAALMAGTCDSFEFSYHGLRPSGVETWVDATVSLVEDAGGGSLYGICMARDVTALHQSERQRRYDQTHDALTSLPNRYRFEEILNQRFGETTAALDAVFAVIFINLDHFKDVNDSLGHGAGDMVLARVADRLRAVVDSDDVVARLGGDEFAILIRSLADIVRVEQLARRVVSALGKSIELDGRSIYVGASLGVAVGSSGYERATDVLRDAEIAMQQAKSQGGTRYAIFDSRMHARAARRIQLASDLRSAVERRELRLLYQPILDIVDGRCVACEALLRWDHPTQGVISPVDFIMLAEQIGLASSVGSFVLESACAQVAAWKERGGAQPCAMHVNISAAELIDGDFTRRVLATIARHGVDPGALVLEITEHVVLETGPRATSVLEALREHGIQICIDDFGTGYSSLSYLQQFRIDWIKIDRSFVAGDDGELASEPIVKTLLALAEAYDVRVVAEGVESERQRLLLKQAGCRFAQGFLYAQPLSPEQLLATYPEVLYGALRTGSS